MIQIAATREANANTKPDMSHNRAPEWTARWSTKATSTFCSQYALVHRFSTHLAIRDRVHPKHFFFSASASTRYSHEHCHCTSDGDDNVDIVPFAFWRIDRCRINIDPPSGEELTSLVQTLTENWPESRRSPPPPHSFCHPNRHRNCNSTVPSSRTFFPLKINTKRINFWR